MFYSEKFLYDNVCIIEKKAVISRDVNPSTPIVVTVGTSIYRFKYQK